MVASTLDIHSHVRLSFALDAALVSATNDLSPSTKEPNYASIITSTNQSYYETGSSFQQLHPFATMTSSSSTPTTTGVFESCFAAGLDLSEFDGSTTTAPATSHAAQLLVATREKAQERLQAQQQEDALARAVLTKATTQKDAKTVTTSNPVHAAVLQMHATDATTIQQTQRRRNNVKKGPKSHKKHAHAKRDRNSSKQGKRRRR